MHSALELVEPRYLSLKEELTENNGFGVSAYTALLDLGYWKKLVYLLDYNSSMALASDFADFMHFKTIYLMKNGRSSEVKKYSGLPGFEFIP